MYSITHTHTHKRILIHTQLQIYIDTRTALVETAVWRLDRVHLLAKGRREDV